MQKFTLKTIKKLAGAPIKTLAKIPTKTLGTIQAFRNHQKSARSKRKGQWGGPRPNSGGKREGAGRKLKEYPPIEIDYDPCEDKESLLRALEELHKWVLEDKIYYRKAATLIHGIEVMAKIRIPTAVEERVDELAVQAEIVRKALANRATV